ncbi:MAG: hypothetical protein P4L35_04485 [Ignavibacteriaceae bacterium]|nr:hypothetical protein [Ignavibacteriaceae bacterium]
MPEDFILFPEPIIKNGIEISCPDFRRANDYALDSANFSGTYFPILNKWFNSARLKDKFSGENPFKQGVSLRSSF